MMSQFDASMGNYYDRDPNEVICLMGPTASGKTALAMALCEVFPFEIVSVDSVMIYREMDVGTAKPTLAEQHIAPHHMIDILNPNETFSVAAFCEQASTWINQIHHRGKIPLLVGGTMMYFHALQKGLSKIPATDPLQRVLIEEEARSVGWPSLHARLAQIDPLSAQRIKPQDTQRITRALAVFYTTNQPMSSFLVHHDTAQSWCFYNLGLMPLDRAWLHERIAIRFQQMLEQGFLDEARRLIAKWDLNLTYPAMRAVGYRQAYEFLDNSRSEYALFVEKGIAATRQLAKRQMTWLRSFDETVFFDPCELDVLKKMSEFLKGFIAFRDS